MMATAGFAWRAPRQPLLCLLLGCTLLISGPVISSTVCVAQLDSDPLSNVVPLQPEVAQAWQDGFNDSLLTFQADIVVRFEGSRFIPFTAEDQLVIIQAFDVINTPPNFIELATYKEMYLEDATTPEGIATPAVELAFKTHWVLPKAGVPSARSSDWQALAFALQDSYLTWVTNMTSRWPGLPRPSASYYNYDIYFQGGAPLHPIIVFDTTLAAIGASSPGGGGGLSAQQADAVAAAVEASIVGGVGTLVELVGVTQSDGRASRTQLLKFEVTLLRCRENATVASPNCEQQVLAAVLAQLLQSAANQQQWQAAGIQNVEVVSISQRQPPSPPNSEALPRIPWHLDRIDQRSLPLDGTYRANATGTGVNVYIVSSGVLADHEEFRYADDASQSRVKPAYGYNGLDPLRDCGDAYVWRGFGTSAASTCCGLRLGVAKNATIHSVRFRDLCIPDPSYWADGALPAALDTVLSAQVKPAVVLIDTWWFPGRISGIRNDSDYIEDAINTRLDLLHRLNITVVAPAGPGLSSYSPCDNFIARHPAVISVAASDTRDQSTAFGPRNSSCINIYAPSGGLGAGLVMANPISPSSYNHSMSRASGAAALVAGVAAQYLQLHPNATPTEVLASLLSMATPHTIIGAGAASPALLLYTNLTQPVDALGVDELPIAGISISSLSSGAVAAIIIASLAVVAVAAAGLVFVVRKKRKSNRPPKALGQLDRTDWEVAYEEIEICRRPDGSEWLLGEGRYGKVYKALKGGVQEVAVKQHGHIDEEVKAGLMKELEMMTHYSRRDANIVPFFGACLHDDCLMLVVEYMEGGDLRSALSAEGSGELQWYKRGKDVMLDVLRGLDFLHGCDVVHGDLGSKSIMLARDGCAKIANAGLAQLRDSQRPFKAFIRNMAWAGPEILLGEECTVKTDIYSLGVVLWELVTLETPQRGCLRDPEVPQECSQGVADAINACMQQDPDLRPTAKELHQLLMECPPSEDYQATPSDSDLGQTLDASTSTSTLFGTRLNSTPLTLVDFPRITFCSNPDGSRQKLGSGAYSIVYRVVLDDVPLAAKEIELGRDPSAQSAFIQEAETLFRLQHPNVVNFRGVSVSQGKGYLLMELMEGGSLHKVLDSGSKHRTFGWYGRGRAVALDIAQGIKYLHSVQITHFDLKSQNILLTSEGIAKLADCGLARVMSRTHHSLGFVGTVAYMAPELMIGSQCTQSVDIFSFGVLLWEICTGQQPNVRDRPGLRVPKDCPDAVRALYIQCTSSEPEGRPSAQQLVERLSLIGSDSGPSTSS